MNYGPSLMLRGGLLSSGTYKHDEYQKIIIHLLIQAFAHEFGKTQRYYPNFTQTSTRVVGTYYNKVNKRFRPRYEKHPKGSIERKYTHKQTKRTLFWIYGSFKSLKWWNVRLTNAPNIWRIWSGFNSILDFLSG